jgi:hypothetical protein
MCNMRHYEEALWHRSYIKMILLLRRGGQFTWPTLSVSDTSRGHHSHSLMLYMRDGIQ